MTKRPVFRSLRYGMIGIVFTGCILLLVWLVASPNYLGGNVSKVRDIFNRLRQIDGAKQQWAYEHNQTNDVVVTKEDLATLFRGWSDKRYPDAWFKPLAGELYTINTLCKSPEAVLTRKVERLPKGTVLRFGTNLNEEIILPNKITGANAGGLPRSAIREPLAARIAQFDRSAAPGL